MKVAFVVNDVQTEIAGYEVGQRFRQLNQDRLVQPLGGDDLLDIILGEAILADPKWSEVVAAAKQAQTRLLALISDPSERQSLSERSPHALAAVQKG